MPLFFEIEFNGEEKKYKKDKEDGHPKNALIVFTVQVLVLFIGKYHNCNKTNEENSGKDQLTRTEHNLSIFGKITSKTASMERKLKAVELFHRSFGLGINQAPVANLGEEKNLLRFNLMDEENREYMEAATNGDLVEVADALGDMLYILCGTILEHGMQYKIEEVFEEIQRSNMSKLGADGKPIYREDGKVLKGPNYFKPDIKKILDK